MYNLVVHYYYCCCCKHVY